MPKLYRDVAPFEADFSSMEAHWAFRGLFQYSGGTIKKRLRLNGIDEMRRALRDLENGTIKIVRPDNGYDDSLNYVRVESKEKLVKEELRKKINSLENNYDYLRDGEPMSCLIICDRRQV